jgi:diguanylate cyclase (GGDEF)-like protein
MVPFPDRRNTESAYADIQVELTRMVFNGLAATVVTGGVAIVAATAIMAANYSDPALWGISIAIFSLVSWRLVLIRAVTAEPDAELTATKAYRWELFFGLSTILYAAVIAAVPLHVFRSHEANAEAWCAMGIFAIVSGIGGRGAARPWIAQIAGAIMLLALSYALLRSDALLVRCSTSSVLGYLFFHCQSVRSKFVMAVEQIRTKRQLADLAQQDPLTGLANRRHFESRLGLACQQASEFAILYVDLDKFKAVNDSYGHGVGDVLLQAVAARLRKAVRGTDLIARIGGDEFAILQAAPVTEDFARALAARINHDMAEVFEIEGLHLRIGASIGIRLVTDAARDAAMLLRSADSALYLVKKNGGGGFSFAKQSALASLQTTS